MQTLPRHDRSGPSEPPVPDEEIMPAEQPIPDEEIRVEPSHDPSTIWSFYVFFLLTFYIRLVNPIFLMFYILGLVVLLEHHAYCISFPSNTYIYHFLLYSLFSLLFYLWNMWFLLYDSDFVPLRRYHFLPLFFLIALETLRTMFSLVGGRVEEGSFCY